MKYCDIKKLWIVLFLIILGLANCYPQKNKEKNNLTLWYKTPAQKWEEALPMGNGRLGVMIFGDTQKERIQLNDDSMLPSDMGWKESKANKEDLAKIRKALIAGKNDEADKLYVEKFSRKEVIRSHQTMGDLWIELNNKNITDYKRELDISKAFTCISYKTKGKKFSEKIFVSHPHQAVIIELATKDEAGFNGKIKLTRPTDKGFPTSLTFTKDNNLLIMQGEVTQRQGKFNSLPSPILKGVKFETCLKVFKQGGKIKKGKDFLELKNVKKATLYLVANTSYYHKNYKEENKKNLSALINKNFNELKKEHIKDYQDLFNRVDFYLNEDKQTDIPTDKRLENIKNDSIDLYLEALLFQYGRYLLISSSRPNTNPASLQGIWNKHIKAPWNNDYHLNINLQMNYWLANLTNLDELNLPLFNLIDKLIANGQKTAMKNFACRGAFIPHATDLWGSTWPRAITAYWGGSIGSGGWLMQHYYNHFEFTQDTIFLKERLFPALHQVALFYSDWLISDPRDNTLVSAPSTSPENRFLLNGKKVATCMGSAMDQQIIREVFTNYIKTCDILKEKNSLYQTIKKQLKRLRPGFIIGSDGRILEWDREYPETEKGHRHISHIYGFHPGSMVSIDKTPKIFKAVKKTLNYRLAKGGAGTGWSRAWLINCSARLLDGEMAHQNIHLLLRKSMYKNLFDAHPPFQIDGNFGYTAGVAEMLLQSHEENIIRLLPALPKAWKKGEISGLKTRKGNTVSLYWTNHRLSKAIIKAKISNNFILIYKKQKIKVKLNKGQTFTFIPK